MAQTGKLTNFIILRTKNATTILLNSNRYSNLHFYTNALFDVQMTSLNLDLVRAYFGLLMQSQSMPAKSN